MPKYKVKRIKSVWDLMRHENIPLSGSKYSSTLDLSDVDLLALTVKCTYEATSTKGITVYIYTTPDDKNWDTDELVSFEPSHTADTTVQKTVFIDPDAQEIRVKVTNKDTAKEVSNVSVRATITKKELENG